MVKSIGGLKRPSFYCLIHFYKRDGWHVWSCQKAGWQPLHRSFQMGHGEVYRNVCPWNIPCKRPERDQHRWSTSSCLVSGELQNFHSFPPTCNLSCMQINRE